MSNPVDVSVIICTYNRCRLLMDALESLINQKIIGVRYEVIIVNNNSTDQTHNLVQSLVAQKRAEIRYFFEKRQGLSYALNTGIKYAEAPIIALTDDDICVAPDYVEKIKEAFDKHPEAEFLGGKVLPQWKSTPPQWLTSQHWAPLALQDYGEIPFYTNAANPLCLVNKSFRQRVFERVGLFRPEMGRIKDAIGSAEDHDLMLRIWLAGGQGIYIPSVVAFAQVQEERVTKSYHRRWHASHGMFSALMTLKNHDRNGHLVGDSSDVKTLLGSPISIYRKLAVSAWRWLLAILRFREAQAFYYENRVRHSINYILKRFKQTIARRNNSRGK